MTVASLVTKSDHESDHESSWFKKYRKLLN